METNKITAEEFLIKNNVVGMTELIKPILIEFAKIKVKEALIEASEKADVFCISDKIDVELYDYFEVDKQSILDSYDLNEIK